MTDPGTAMRFHFLLTCCFLACCWGRCLSVPQQIINEFKSALLPLFGLKDKPKIDGIKVQIPEALRELYKAQNELEWDTASFPLPGQLTGSANTVRSFTHIESSIDDKFSSHHKKFRLKFDLSSIPKTEKLKAAEIKLTREALTDSKNRFQRVLVVDILQRGVKGVCEPITRVIDSKLVDTRKNSTISVDVFPAVERWLENPAANYGILVVVRNINSQEKQPTRHLRLRRDLSSTWDEQQPLLFAYTDDGRNKQRTGVALTKMRNKRTPKRHLRKQEKNPCQRKQMYVDFREVGWSDWIVAPLGYQAYYCGGECEYPMPEHMNVTNHAIVQSLMNSAHPTEVPKPCCVPTQLSAMSMLYVDQNGLVILKNYKEMVVIGCGCR